MNAIRAVHINNGLGAGNAGDDLMAGAFWNRLPAGIVLEVGVLAESVRLREPYPERHRYRAVDWSGNENAGLTGLPGLLVGDTPVTDAEGLHWPLQFLSPRLQHFHDHGQPVDAVGVGVDLGLGPDARRLFEAHFLPIRSWTVRSPNCREALIALSVPESRIRVGADWAWLYQPGADLSGWARELWRRVQIDPEAPLIVVNATNLLWRDRVEAKRALAAALDWVSEHLEMQVAFLCCECRSGAIYDHAAALEVQAFMSQPAVVVPNEYYSPGEMIALLGCATVALGQRYHFLVQSVLAGGVPVAVLRGQKMRDLASELSIPVAGTVENVDKDEAVMAIRRALDERPGLLRSTGDARARLSKRAMENLSFLRQLPPYSGAEW